MPVLVGGGKQALPDGVRLRLELLDERRFGSGIVYLRYRVRTRATLACPARLSEELGEDWRQHGRLTRAVARPTSSPAPDGLWTQMSLDSSADARVLVGKCECGTVRYRGADEFRYVLNCHCPRCSAATGTAFKAFVGIEPEKLEIARGAR